ncbi:hypothetical protein [Klebsiella pneumoniae]|uniref:hypothetical protein n=1 Tax=Klebsiella pneumoniae TaxID=573 RepID=UPI0010912548|nr:hypothetical protein [Klebsiella pneumoniae]MDN2606028.1 hypothetical protein [Klebsiella variicola]HDG7893957.1 hypothetical protein [Klebsiella quasipneumoniae]HDU3862098.1 hypothetical protein [Klebsiella quasipneumoniae subsp. quasipneumoniae]MCG5595973.1 hypothetical protein [Klebsiella pneumoniae]MCM1581474.1 hypothetical protein [Klebsiella pneumoniae]
MPAISEIKSQGNKKFPFSNTLEGEAAGGSPIPAAFLEEHPKQQWKSHLNNELQKGFFRGAT